MSKPRTMTTVGGVPVADNQNMLIADPRGPVLADFQLMEKMAHDPAAPDSPLLQGRPGVR